MRFTIKDFIGAVLAAAAVVVAIAVTYGWGWPLLSDYRAGTVALGVIGISMCLAVATNHRSTITAVRPTKISAVAQICPAPTPATPAPRRALPALPHGSLR